MVMSDSIVYVDSIIVPISLFSTIGYHAFLWQRLKHKPSQTAIGANMLRRRSWLRALDRSPDDKKAMLAVQSLRNALMSAILTATATVVATLCLAALTNNAFCAADILAASAVFGSQSPRIMLLKYASASIFLLASFVCSSVAVGFLVDANYLVNAVGGGGSEGYTERVAERGFAMAVAGDRVLCMAVPLLLWLFGPVPVAVSSAALVWVLYQLDFAHNLRNLK